LTVELEVVDVLGERQFRDRHLVFDRARVLLRDLRFQKIADHSRWLVLPLNGRRHHFVVRGAHAVKL